MKLLKSFILPGFFSIFINSSVFAQQNGSINGQVFDSLGGVVTGANVIAVDATAKEKSVVTNRQGEFSIKGLTPGKYTVRVTAPKFSLYENSEVEVKAGAAEELTIVLAIEAFRAQVDVGNSGQVSTDADNNASAIVLKGKDLEGLPDDPDELQAYLQALAGPAAGPDGAQFMIDGFSGGRMPPKETISEIRVNSNPFSAEYDRVGFGRVEIFTKPGTNKFGGSLSFIFNDARFNSRNPFALNRAPSQTRNFNGFLSGPIQSKKSSFSVDFSNSQNDSNNVVNATILDPSLNIVSFNQDIKIPNRRFSVGTRLDYLLNDNNTLTVRYNFSRNSSENQGVSGFSLPSRAFDSSGTNQDISLTESMIINPKTINETRFQYEVRHNEQNGDNSIPTINVASAFTGGGAQIGLSYNDVKRWELQNYTTTTLGKNSEHAIRFGVRIRGINIENRQESNYGGTFTFAGLPGLSSIEQYRQKVLGNPDPRFNPTQFSITTGEPLASVSQVDYGLFITDDWKARKDLTLNFGLRYENQSNISDSMNFAPRIGIAWAPGAGGAKQPKTVFRGGFGIFYDRFSENYTLRARRNDGVSQLQYVVTDPAILSQAIFTVNGVTNVPTAAQLSAAAPRSSIPFRIADDLQALYSIQSALSVERQLPYRTTLSVTWVMAKSLHILRTRNINAPVCPTIQVCPATLTTQQINALRPDPTQGNITQIESSAYSNMQRLSFNVNTRLSQRFTMFGSYWVGSAKGDTDSLKTTQFLMNPVGFPAYSYDLSNEHATPIFAPTHNFSLGGNVSLLWGISLSPTVFVVSGRPFNITSGVDVNHDAQFFERPTYAALNARCQALGLTNSFCNIDGISNPDTTVIPRNYGRDSGYFLVNLRFSKTFGFGGGGGDARKPYNLTAGINVQNLFNNVNFNSPQGSLTSPFFGRPTSTFSGFFVGGSENRRIDLSMRLSW